jgi:superfamily II DNA or RNA helicase
MKLREYQNNIINSLRNSLRNRNKKIVMCAPTGAGKTIMFTFMVKNALEKGKKCLILTDRTELLTQSGGALNKFDLKPIEIKPSNKLKSLNGTLYTAMAQTLSRRIKNDLYKEWFKDLDLIIIDEAHKQTFNNLLSYVNEKTIVIGATATPFRDGNQISLDKFYEDIVNQVEISDLIDAGFLAIPSSYGVKVDLSNVKTKGGDYDSESLGEMYDEIKLYDGVYQNYMRVTPNQKAIIFASNVKSSIKLVEELSDKGLPIKHIDGTTPTKERREILNWFKTTDNAMISNVGILNAGFDCPDIKVVILYRATKSISLFLQMCGRGSRVTENKKEFTILDFGNNISTHGFWEQERVWSLKKKKKREGVAPVKDCPECFAIIPARVMECKYCGHTFEPTEKEKKEAVIVELQKMNYTQIKEEIKNADFTKLEAIAEARGYQISWIYHQLTNIKDIKDYAKFKGYNPKWVDYQIKIREIKK